MRKALPVLAMVLAALQPLGGEIIDGIAAVVARQAITRSEVEREARLEAFFQGQPPPDAAFGEELLQRLIRQRLIAPEMEQTAFGASEAEVKRELDRMRPAGADPARHGLVETDLLDFVRRQFDTLRFLDQRFRPGLQVPAEEVDSYYQKVFLPELERRGAASRPPLEEVRNRLEEILRQERINVLVEAWLVEIRSRAGVRVVQ